jgi:hypothetical protein
MLYTQGYEHTLRICNSYYFIRQHLFHKLVWILLYKYIACLGPSYCLGRVEIQNTLSWIEINFDFIFTAINTCERYDVWWRNITGDILRKQPTRKDSVLPSPPGSHWWWSHRMCVNTKTALKPEIQICIVTEQKCAERLYLLTFSSDEWLQMYRMFRKYLQKNNVILSELI